MPLYHAMGCQLKLLKAIRPTTTWQATTNIGVVKIKSDEEVSASVTQSALRARRHCPPPLPAAAPPMTDHLRHKTDIPTSSYANSHVNVNWTQFAHPQLPRSRLYLRVRSHALPAGSPPPPKTCAQPQSPAHLLQPRQPQINLNEPCLNRQPVPSLQSTRRRRRPTSPSSSPSPPPTWRR